MGEWYRKTTKETLSTLNVDQRTGLSTSEVSQRLEQYGRNELESGKKINPFKLFISQFNDILVIILIIAACVSLALSFVGSSSEQLTSAQGQRCVDSALINVADDAALDEFLGFSHEKCSEASSEVIATLANGTEITRLDYIVDSCSASLSLDSDYVCSNSEIGQYTLTSDQVASEHSDSEGITESLLIFGIVLAIAIIGFFNEYKAEKTVEALKKLVGHSARVLRDGVEVEVSAGELVPGDILILEEGQKVPADIRLLEVRALQANEAALTGESLPITKNTHTVDGSSALGDQKNMLFSGTIITTGTGVGVVATTGSDTEIGKIAHLVAEVEDEQTPMQKKLDDLGRRLGALILVICIFVFAIIFFVDESISGDPLVDRLIFAFTVAVALAVAAIPEGLSFVVRISLALGARRMAAKDALVRKLSAVEALGSTDVICSDKTGTLTKGEMTVRELFIGGDIYQVSGIGYGTEGKFTQNGKPVASLKKVHPILRIGTLCNNSQLKDGTILGDPTEGSLIVAAEKGGLTHKEQTTKFHRVDEVPFSSERKMMSTVHQMSKSYLVATKGAPDVLLDSCTKVLWKGKTQKLTPKIKKEIMAANKGFAQEALRVLGFAYKEVKTQPKGAAIEKDLIFIGLQGMMDPPRDEVKEVIHRVHAEAGMRVLMITGDYVETAKAVAAEIGIEGAAISGSELDEMTQDEFEDQVEKISVYARVNPEHKIRIVQALKKHGHQVAMTGDGVNDAPAIKAADIGIAMGINGTDAAKEAADLILLDDEFLTIIDAVEEGRGIFDNVRKFVSYLLGANIAEVLIVVGGIIFLKDPVLTATQLLFINIVTDGLPAVALGSDPAEKGIMRYKPHHFQDAIINKHVWIEMFAYGVMASALLLWHYWYALNNGSPIVAVSAAFTGLVVYELVRLVVLRTNYQIPWFSNPWLSVALVASFVVQIAVLYITPIANLFEIEAFGMRDWLIIAAGSATIFIAMKLVRKALFMYLPEVKPQFDADHYERAA